MAVVIRIFCTVAIAVFLVSSAARLSYIAWSQMTAEPFIAEHVETITKQVRSGEPVSFKYEIVRTRLCKMEITRFFIDLSSSATVYRDIVPGGYAPPGRKTTLVTFPVPHELDPGFYAYRPVFNSDCGLLAYTSIGPDAVFEVTK